MVKLLILVNCLANNCAGSQAEFSKLSRLVVRRHERWGLAANDQRCLSWKASAILADVVEVSLVAARPRIATNAEAETEIRMKAMSKVPSLARPAWLQWSAGGSAAAPCGGGTATKSVRASKPCRAE